MPEFSITTMNDFDVSQDGRKTILNFNLGSGDKLALKITTLDLQRFAQELGLVLTETHKRSDISKQDIVPMFRPPRYRASLMPDAAMGPAVVVTFGMDNGLEYHFGLAPNGAERLAHQMIDQAGEGKKARPPSRN